MGSLWVGSDPCTNAAHPRDVRGQAGRADRCRVLQPDVCPMARRAGPVPPGHRAPFGSRPVLSRRRRLRSRTREGRPATVRQTGTARKTPATELGSFEPLVEGRRALEQCSLRRVTEHLVSVPQAQSRCQGITGRGDAVGRTVQTGVLAPGVKLAGHTGILQERFMKCAGAYACLIFSVCVVPIRALPRGWKSSNSCGEHETGGFANR